MNLRTHLDLWLKTWSPNSETIYCTWKLLKKQPITFSSIKSKQKRVHETSTNNKPLSHAVTNHQTFNEMNGKPPRSFLWKATQIHYLVKLICSIFGSHKTSVEHCYLTSRVALLRSAGPTRTKTTRVKWTRVGRAGERRGKRSVSRRRPRWARTNDKREAKCCKTHSTYKPHHEYSHDVRIEM